MQRAMLFGCALLLPLWAGCGGPAHVAGDYTIAVTNRENGCGFDGWTVGASASNIPLTVTQSGSAVTAVVGGTTGAFMHAILGSKTFTGSVHGDDISMTLYGTRTFTEGECAYTVIATAHADLTGDTLSGTIEYTLATNGSPQCASYENCVSVQAFNGVRPPLP